MDANAAENIIERLSKQSTFLEDELAELKTVRASLIDALLAECGVDGDASRKLRLEHLLDRLVAVQYRLRKADGGLVVYT